MLHIQAKNLCIYLILNNSNEIFGFVTDNITYFLKSSQENIQINKGLYKRGREGKEMRKMHLFLLKKMSESLHY